MASFAHRLARQSSSESRSSSRISKRGPNACTRIFESLRSRRCRRPGRAKIERWRCRYPAAGVPEGLGSGGTDAPLRGGRTGLSNARVDAARGAQHGAAMIAEGLKVVCVQRVDEGHIVESALGHPARRPNPRPPRDFGNRWITRNLYDLSKAYFAVTFLSSSPTCPATQSALCGSYTAPQEMHDILHG